jgi:hypothetical protein
MYVYLINDAILVTMFSIWEAWASIDSGHYRATAKIWQFLFLLINANAELYMLLECKMVLVPISINKHTFVTTDALEPITGHEKIGYISFSFTCHGYVC